MGGGYETAYHTTHEGLIAAAWGFTPDVETEELGRLYAEISGLDHVAVDVGRMEERGLQ